MFLVPYLHGCIRHSAAAEYMFLGAQSGNCVEGGPISPHKKMGRAHGAQLSICLGRFAPTLTIWAISRYDPLHGVFFAKIFYRKNIVLKNHINLFYIL
uniref:Uncharacterized protein n=1 Tax=Oryza brachyantha TaxID=4533 RepID=J3NES4_ORYBR